jgi:hypothetical protein
MRFLAVALMVVVVVVVVVVVPSAAAAAAAASPMPVAKAAPRAADTAVRLFAGAPSLRRYVTVTR